MTSNLLPEFKSKEACPRCSEHKLFTNDSEEDNAVRYHCLHCNYEFSETSDYRAYKKRKKKEQIKEAPSSFLGFTLFVLMMVVILTVTVDQEPKRETPQPADQVELVP